MNGEAKVVTVQIPEAVARRFVAIWIDCETHSQTRAVADIVETALPDQHPADAVYEEYEVRPDSQDTLCARHMPLASWLCDARFGGFVFKPPSGGRRISYSEQRLGWNPREKRLEYVAYEDDAEDVIILDPVAVRVRKKE